MDSFNVLRHIQKAMKRDGVTKESRSHDAIERVVDIAKRSMRTGEVLHFFTVRKGGTFGASLRRNQPMPVDPFKELEGPDRIY